jgi:monoglucosyldiacylglycerol epimerase
MKTFIISRLPLLATSVFCLCCVGYSADSAVLQLLSIIVAPLSVGVGWFATDWWHWQCHQSNFLYKWLHKSHHDAFLENWQIEPNSLFKSRIRHDVVESVLMLTVCGSFLAILYYFKIPGWPGAAYGLLHSMQALYNSLRIGLFCDFGHFLRSDKNHQPQIHQPSTIPSRLFVNRVYHARHHYFSDQAFFAGKISLFDRLIGGSVDLKQTNFVIVGENKS